MKTRVCSKCEIEKPLDCKNFPENKRCREGFDTWCKECHKIAGKLSKRRLAASDPNYHKNIAMRKHHWTPEQYAAALEEQGGHCALCSATTSRNGERLSVDHNHEICPGKYACDKCRRGLLCSSCNARLGYLEQTLGDFPKGERQEICEVDFRNMVAKDSWTHKALQYLRRYSA